MRQETLPLLGVLVALLVWVPLVSSATYYVATTGNNSNAGTIASPFLTVNRGVQALAGGDTLILRQGIYTEGIGVSPNLPNGSSGSPTTIRSFPGEVATLRPSNINVDCVVFIKPGQAWVTLQSLVIDGGNSSGTRLSAFPVCAGDAGSPTSTVNNISVFDSEIKHGRHSGFLTGGTVWRVERNHIHDNGVDNTFDHGLYFESANSFIRDNYIHNNACYNIQVYSSAGANPTTNTLTGNIFSASGCGVTLPMGANHLFANNIIYQDATSGTSGALICCGNNSKIFNNTIVNNASPGILVGTGQSDSGAQVRNNIVFNNSGGNISVRNAIVSNNITSNPQFADARGGNFRVTAGSPAIGAGMRLDEVLLDIAGIRRPATGPYTVGAYEAATQHQSAAEVWLRWKEAGLPPGLEEVVTALAQKLPVPWGLRAKVK